MTRTALALVACGAVLLVGSLVLQDCYSDERRQWEDRLAARNARNFVLRQTADSAKAEARQYALDAARHRARADSIADVAERADTVLRERTRVVRAETPDSLRDHPAIIQRDSLIDAWRGQASRWKAAYSETLLEALDQRRRAQSLAVALQATTTALDSLEAVVQDRPGEDPWWLPKLSIGPQAGVSSRGDPYVGAGVTLGWELEL